MEICLINAGLLQFCNFDIEKNEPILGQMNNKYEQMLYKNQFHIEFWTTFVFNCQ